ncbi:unnamed protein product, partial [Ectocarpus sp. 8 AP-2014]
MYVQNRTENDLFSTSKYWSIRFRGRFDVVVHIGKDTHATTTAAAAAYPRESAQRVPKWRAFGLDPALVVMSSEDRAALVALFQSTGTTRWYRKGNWDTDADLSQWEGVAVNDDGRVVELNLALNNLKGTIPAAVGALTDLNVLDLYDNELTGPIPEALRALKELTHLGLSGNKLTGIIPAWLGSLKKLQRLELDDNHLVGPIPEALGALKELEVFVLGLNELTGKRKLCEQSMIYLADLWLQSNQLVRHVPKELGDLENLRELYLQDNFLTGTAIPTELGNLIALLDINLGNTQLTGESYCWRKHNEYLDSDKGGPAEGEGLDSWRARMRLQQETEPQALKGDKKEEDAPVPPTPPPPVLLLEQQQPGEGDEQEEDAPVPPGSPNQREEVVGGRVRSPENASLSPGKAEEVDRLFSAQLSSSAGFDSLIKIKPAALEDIQRVIEAPAAGSFHFDDELSDMERRRKLGTLVTMSNALGEVALRHTEDMDVQRKELALPPFPKSYYTAVRSGLCQAYLAASVIDSDWVSTSKTGRVSKAGTALKLMSSAVPVVGGLTGLAGKALETGDHYLQTRRLVKITAMAADVVECCSLARRLALQLTDSLRNDASTTADNADEVRVDTTAGMNGGSGCGRGADMMPGDMSEEDVFEYLLEEVASYERNDHGGKRLGKKHLRKLLKAIQRGCLGGLSCTDQKIKVLLLEVLPEADSRPAATSSTPKEVIVRSPPVVAATRDDGLPSMADFAAMRAELAALKSAKDKQQAELEEQQEELEALKSDKDQQQTELEGLTSAKEELERKVKKLEKHVPELESDPDDDVDCAAGLALRRRVAVTETAEGFLDRARDRAARAADHHPVTVAKQREFEALQNEKHREHESRLRELEGQISKATKRKG